MSTIKDVAKIAGVSIATVSRVVNNNPKVGKPTRDRVLKVMSELGYTPNANARALVKQSSTTLGVVIPDLSDPFFATLATGVDKIANQHNMQMLLSTGHNDENSERRAINLLIEQRCDAVVVHSKRLSDQELIEYSEKVPGLVLIDRYIEQISHRCIWLDNYEGGRIAARHLASLNHKNVACISSEFQIDDPILRLNGFEQGAKEMGLTLEQDLIALAEPTLKGGEVASQQLLAQNKPFSALFVYNDAMAIGAISTLEDYGYKVPHDISVIGFDDVLLSRYSRPKLTTLNYPIEQMANDAASLAVHLRGKNLESELSGHKYLPRLVKRESVIARSPK